MTHGILETSGTYLDAQTLSIFEKKTMYSLCILLLDMFIYSNYLTEADEQNAKFQNSFLNKLPDSDS